MKRILLVIKGLNRGGAERLLADVLRHRDTSAFTYEVAYLLPGAAPMIAEIRSLGVPVHCLHAGPTPAWAGRLAALVRRRSIDLVHTHAPYPAIGARLRLRGSRRPVQVYTEHSVWEGYRRATYWGNLLTFPLNDHVFAVSEHVKHSMRYPPRLSRLPMPPIEALYHGIDPAAIEAHASVNGVRTELGISEHAPVVGSVANFTPQKAHTFLLRAVDILRREVPGLRVVLVGGGPLEAEVRSYSHELGLDETVVFTGTRSDAVRIASCFDVFTLASTQEGLSIALLEAMALGKPSVVTRVGGLPEAIHDGMGFVVPPRQPDQMADALRVLLADPALRRDMGEAARSRAADFDVRKATRRIEQVYEALLS